MLYDGASRRISKETNNTKTTFTWDGDYLLSDNVGEENYREFVYYPDSFEPLAFIDKANEIFYFHNDAVGLPHEITDSENKIVWSARYDSLGNIDKLYETKVSNPIRFQGQYYDEELDLSYNRHRYFNADIGSFISIDPLGLEAGTNLYRYAPNVWGWIDPLGLCGQSSKNKITVYRVFGGDARAQGFSWTTENPTGVKNFRNLAGLPSGGESGAINSADFMVIGKVETGDIITTRSALPLDGNVGGLSELIIDPKNVNLIDFSVLKQ